MRIEVKETQDLIRRVTAESHKEVAQPLPLGPQEAGMATGPRMRHRSFTRPGSIPDYVSPSAARVDEWQHLDDDVYKLLQRRRPQFESLPSSSPSHQFIMEVEAQLAGGRREYEPGTFLGLVRLAADLDDTRRTLVTASEQGSFYALIRRITTGRREGEYFDPVQTSRFMGLLQSGVPTVARGMADLLRFMARAARLPLLGNIQEAPALCLSTFLEIVDLSGKFNQAGEGQFEFQVSPLDVFLAARSVLFNRSVANPTFSMIRELVLNPNGLYHDDLQEWLQSVGLFGSDLTVLMPPKLSEEGFALGEHRFSAMELVSAGGARLGKAPSRSDWGLQTLGDALIHRIQRQDLHKDYQIQTLLGHFNELLRSERRSASRVQEDRKQVRFDYMQAIQRASDAAREAKTGYFPVLKPTANEAPGLVYEKSDAGLTPPTRDQLREWDTVLQSTRRRLSSKSPVFRALVSQLAKARALDTALAFGLTPGGSRCLGRFMRILQNEDARRVYPLDSEGWTVFMSALNEQPTTFLAELQSLILALYGFQGSLEDVQFRYRDRLHPDQRHEALEGENLVGDEATYDESLLGLLVGVLLLELGLFTPKAGSRGAIPSRKNPGSPDVLLGYAAFLHLAKDKMGSRAPDDIEASHRLLWALPTDMLAYWTEVRERISLTTLPILLPGFGELEVRSGWRQGCESGLMAEVEENADQPGADFDHKLLALMTQIQPFLDSASASVEAEKSRLAAERFRQVLV